MRFPAVIRHRKAEVTIYGKSKHHPAYRIAYYVAGQPHQQRFAARYTKMVAWSDEDRCFVGRCPEIMLGGVHGHDEAKVYAELCQAVEEMIAPSEPARSPSLRMQHWKSQ